MAVLLDKQLNERLARLRLLDDYDGVELMFIVVHTC